MSASPPRRAGLFPSLLLLVAPATQAPVPVPAPEPLPPHNVLVIIADDLGIDALSTYGLSDEAAPTPHLTRLAEGGVRFQTVISQPVCSPSRSVILTGRYPHETGIGVSIPFEKPHSLDHHVDSSPMLPRLLPASYRSIAIGKWHLDIEGRDAPIRRGFTEYRGSLEGTLPSYTDYLHTIARADGVHTAPIDTYATTQEVDDALKQIAGTPAGQPWFVWLAFHAPHSPWSPPPPELHSFGDLSDADDTLLYRATVEAMDREIGRLLHGIDPAVLARTTVIFLGDNGTPKQVRIKPRVVRGGKGQVYEGGTRVPMIIAGPVVHEPGRQVEALVDLIDLHATILELTGSHAPAPVHSVSLLPYLRRPGAAPQRGWAHARKMTPNGPYARGKFEYVHAMVRDARYKLILRRESTGAPALEFFDLAKDPKEKTDLMADGSPDNLSGEMRAAFERLTALLDSLGGV